MSQIVRSTDERLAESLNDALSKNPHLVKYLDNIAKKGQPLPDYVEQLSQEMKYAKEVNIIYPVGDPIFIHIKSRRLGERPLYIVIQPVINEKIHKMIELIEEILISHIDEKIEFNTIEEHEAILRKTLRKIVRIDGGVKLGEYRVERKNNSKIVYVNSETY